MRLLRPLAVLVLAAAMALLPAAEAVTAKLAKKGNVRYGPSKSAPIAVTLSSDTEVELLGKVTKDDGVWYQIRFPREGRAWMHEKTLKVSAADPKIYDVVEDKARVRDDATAGANIVAELSKGDTVELRANDNKTGMWLPVFPAKAVAYVHESVLAVPQVGAPAVANPNNPAAVPAKPKPIDRLWSMARDTYARYAATSDLKQALTLDWAGLSKQLGEVAKSHPDLSVQLEAVRLKNGVDAVVKEQVRQGVHATTSVPQPPAEAVVTTPDPVEPIVTPVGPTDPVVALPKPSDGQATTTSPEVQQVMGGPAAGTYVVQGILEQRGDIFVVYDNGGKVVAVLQAKPGATLQLTDYYWREIGVKGSSPGTGKDDQGNDVPIVLVDDVELLKR